jgi:integrase
MPQKGTYSINTILKVIARKEKELAPKSVLSAPAQTFDLCKTQQQPVQLHLQIRSALNYWKIKYPILFNFATIQLQSGARVSEILRLHSKEITPDNRILIRSLKGGNDRIVQISGIDKWISSERTKSRYLFQDLTRFVIHHNYVQQGISAHFGNNTKRSTTHLFRHLVGIDLNHLENSTHGIKKGLGQKTDKAADYYKTKIRREDDQ